MVYVDHGGEVEIKDISDFDIAKTFECGQCFRWNADENGIYTGVAFGCAARVRQINDSIFVTYNGNDFEDVWRDYFDLDRDYENIRRHICIDDFMRSASSFGAGIRILRQDSWEALCSFIISQRNNIPRIKGIINTLCKEFGEKLVFGGKGFFTFPPASTLARLDEADLAPLRCGYRAQYIIEAARAVVGGSLDLSTISRLSPQDARAELKKVRGVGDKVADCVILFGFNMLDAFPVDVWINRAISTYYGRDFDPAVFSPYAGVAQQYIYYYTRNVKNACFSDVNVVE